MEDRPKLDDAPEKSGKRKKETAGARRPAESMHWLRLVDDRRPGLESPPAADKDKPESLLALPSDGGPKEKRIGAFVQELSERPATPSELPTTEYQAPAVSEVAETAATEVDVSTKQFEVPTLKSAEWTAWRRPKVETTPVKVAEGDELPPEAGDAEKPPEPPEDSGPETLAGDGAGSPPERPPTDRAGDQSEPAPEPRRQEWEAAARQAAGSSYEQLPTPTRMVERRRNGLGALTFIGLVGEFFGRRRHDRRLDRKHTREERRIQKEVKKLDQRLYRAESRPTERWTPPPEALHPRAVEAKPLPWQRVMSPEAPVPKQPEQPKRREAPETAEQLKRRLEALKSPEAHHLRPDEVLHQVEEAAKRKIAVEAIYERRHEVKDEPQVNAPLGGTGGVFDRPQTPPAPKAPPAGPSTYTPRPAPPPLTPDFSTSSKQYGTAMRRGFWTALIVIIAIVIILLLK